MRLPLQEAHAEFVHLEGRYILRLLVSEQLLEMNPVAVVVDDQAALVRVAFPPLLPELVECPAALRLGRLGACRLPLFFPGRLPFDLPGPESRCPGCGHVVLVLAPRLFLDEFPFAVPVRDVEDLLLLPGPYLGPPDVIDPRVARLVAIVFSSHQAAFPRFGSNTSSNIFARIGGMGRYVKVSGTC